MSSGTIQFLKLRRRGLDTQELYNQALIKRDEEHDVQLRRETEELISRQDAVEAKVNSLVTRIAALDVVGPGRAQVEALQKKAQLMRGVQEELLEVLQKKKTELRTRQQDIAGLVHELGCLRHLLREEPSPYESELLKVGALMTKHIGEK